MKEPTGVFCYAIHEGTGLEWIVACEYRRGSFVEIDPTQPIRAPRMPTRRVCDLFNHDLYREAERPGGAPKWFLPRLNLRTRRRRWAETRRDERVRLCLEYDPPPPHTRTMIAHDLVVDSATVVLCLIAGEDPVPPTETLWKAVKRCRPISVDDLRQHLPPPLLAQASVEGQALLDCIVEMANAHQPVNDERDRHAALRYAQELLRRRQPFHPGAT